MSQVTATYLVKAKKEELAKKAEGIALGLTVGSWTDLPAMEQEQLKAHKGHVEEVKFIESDDGIERGFIKISYPSLNFTPDLPAILTTVFGKLSLDGEVKLIDLNFSNELKSYFPGPRYGIEGVRELVEVKKRPLLMSIFKAAIGRDLDSLHEQMLLQALGGVDIIKDDEILFENEKTPLEERVPVCLAAITEAAETTGHRPLYAVNITGRTSQLKDRAKQAIDLGAPALLVNVFAYGLDVLQDLREDSEIDVPILAHPAVSGAMTSSAYYGFSHQLLLGKLLRMVGADLVLFPSPYGNVALAKDKVLGIVASLTKQDDRYKKAFPVPSAGIHSGMTEKIISDFGTDIVINAGGGIHGHPGGAIAGGKAFRHAIDGVMEQKSLLEVAHTSLELRQAIDSWGYLKP